MADPYDRAKGGRLTFKGGSIATRKSIEKKKHKKKNKSKQLESGEAQESEEIDPALLEAMEGEEATGEAYTIDAAKRLKYDQLFPVEARKFGYEPKSNSKSIEDALDDRVKKKADRYCK